MRTARHLLILVLVLLGSRLQATPVASVTVFSPSGQLGPTYSNTATLTGIRAGLSNYSGFVAPSSTALVGATPVYSWGTSGTSPTTLNQALANGDVMTGILNPGGQLNLVFSSPISDTNGNLLDVFLFEPNSTTAENWTLQAITGGDASAPVLGGNVLSFNSNAMGSTGITGSYARVSGGNFTQGILGAGWDLGADFGLSSLIGVQIQTAAGDPVAVVAGGTATPALNGVESLTTTNNGGRMDLTGVTVARNGVVTSYAAAELINVDVVHFNTSNNSVLIVPDGQSPPATGSRAALLEDFALNTGLINPGAGTGLSADPTPATPGLGVAMLQPMINGEGIDVLVFEVDNDAEDPFVVSPLVFDRPGLTSYQPAGAELARLLSPQFDIHRFSTGPQSLADLEAFSVSASDTAPSGYVYRAYAIDLSDLGYALGDAVPGLFLQSRDSGNLFDPTLIVGFPSNLAPVPEPSAFCLALLAACGASWTARRLSRRGRS